jgi:flagellar protein FlaG
MSVANVGFNVSPMPVPETRGQAVRQSPQPEKTVKPQVVQSTAADLHRLGNAINKKLQFVVDPGSNEVRIKVIDRETDKVIKVLPPEELQRLHTSLREAIGLLFDEMA